MTFQDKKMTKNTAIFIRDKNTWPPEVEEFLEQHKELLIDKKIVEYKTDKLKNDPQRDKGEDSFYELPDVIANNELPLAIEINQIYKKYSDRFDASPDEFTDFYDKFTNSHDDSENKKFIDCRNKFNYFYDEFIEGLIDILQKYSLLVVHYTRLTEYEIDKIDKNGLRLLNPEFLSERIDKLVEQEDLTVEQASELRTYNGYNVNMRRGPEFYFTSGDPFEGETSNSKEGDIIRSLCSWGGDILYRDSKVKSIGEKLREIGIPCILEAIVPCSILSRNCLHEEVVDRLKNAYLKNNNITHEGKELFVAYKGYDVYTEDDITNDDMKKIKITRIIRYDENKEEFIRFTGCDKWDEQLTL